MSWEPNNESFLKMMQVNSRLFGEEILSLHEADEKFLIKYFETQLSEMMEWSIFIGTKYSYKTFKHDSIETLRLRDEGFGLNKTECIKIFEYIYSRARYHDGYKRYMLHWTDTVIVLNYINDKYPLDEEKYKLVKYDGIGVYNYER